MASPKPNLTALIFRWQRGQGGSLAGRAEDSIADLWGDFQKIAALELGIYARNQLLRDADVFSMASPSSYVCWICVS